ncbi:MAG TPA: paraquat-inducible protein A [Albitalea sp.]|nr:paraquat-inducible protein A [Albitalea sp.]
MNEVLGCQCCGLVSALPRAGAPGAGDALALRCPRCGHLLREPRRKALQHTWAYLAAALMLYVPANVLPIMTNAYLFRRTSYTISGGIGELWADKEFGLAAIVFVASIAVPLLKIGALALLAWTTSAAPHWRRLERAKLYRVVETVGHWSMLDVYVVVLLAGVVRFGKLANVQPEPGLLAFAAVVVLTMLAARSFDPRLIWQEGPAR